MNNKIYIFGYSGHSYVVLDSLAQTSFEVLGYFDKYESEKNLLNIKYMGDETVLDLQSIVEADYVFPTVGDNKIREKIIKLFNKYELRQTTVIDANASVSPNSIIGGSTFIASGAIINSFAKIGQGCIVNSGSIIEHDCTLGDYVHIAPGAVLTGNVSLGKGVFIGANAVVNPGVQIGENAIIGSGSVVLKDVPKNTKWVGNPARQI